MINLTIDGKKITAKPGRSVLEAALDAGIYIPNICYHPDLRPVGACRLCIVEIDGMRGLPTACTVEARDGMVVKTNTPALQEQRQYLVWLILSEHPKELRENDQLKKVVDYIGVKDVLKGFTPGARELPINAEEPMIVRDMSRCILCGRCVRMCQEVRGVGAIGFTERGIQSAVDTSAEEARIDSGCRFCGACIEVCPTGALTYKEDAKGRSHADFCVACSHACPAGIEIPTYINLIAEGKFQDALEVIRERVPFPGVLGRVCPHPCQTACHRNEVNSPAMIRDLKRFVADRDTGRWRAKMKPKPATGKKVAIIGSGPTGLATAWMLRKFGHDATVFEAQSKPGGAMRTGIPRYRLPEPVLNNEIHDIETMGARIKCNQKITDLDALFNQGYDAVVLALGAAEGAKMGIPGENDPRVMEGLNLLEAIAFGREVDLGKSIAVVGGGNVAMDVARSALRLGVKEVNIIYRRTQKEMPAWEEEVDFAKEEGIKFHFLVAPSKVEASDGSLKVQCIRMELGAPDKSGRRSPVPVPGSEFTLNTDRLIMAIGQRVNMPKAWNLAADKGGKPVVDKNTSMTSRKGVFAGGDMVSGPATVIEAIHSGRLAAQAVDAYLGGTGQVDEKLVDREEEKPWLGRDEEFAKKEKTHPPVLPLAERLTGFPEVEKTLDEKTAMDQAGRCLRCGLRLKIAPAPMPPEKSAK